CAALWPLAERRLVALPSLFPGVSVAGSSMELPMPNTTASSGGPKYWCRSRYTVGKQIEKSHKWGKCSNSEIRTSPEEPMKYHWLLGVCLLASLLGVSVSCNTGSGAETHGSQSPAAMSVLLNEFAFVGSEPIHQEDIGRHEVVPISPPTHYTVGHQ